MDLCRELTILISAHFHFIIKISQHRCRSAWEASVQVSSGSTYEKCDNCSTLCECSAVTSSCDYRVCKFYLCRGCTSMMSSVMSQFNNRLNQHACKLIALTKFTRAYNEQYLCMICKSSVYECAVQNGSHFEDAICFKCLRKNKVTYYLRIYMLLGRLPLVSDLIQTCRFMFAQSMM